MVLNKSWQPLDKIDEDTEVCSECGSKDINTDYARGETICSHCGIVLSFRDIDQGPEWRAFSTEELQKRDRVGSPPNFTVHDKGLSTAIDRQNKDAFGKQLTPNRKAQIYRLRKWQSRSRVGSSSERNLRAAMAELERLSSQLGIPRGVKETAALLYRRALEKKLIRGHSIESMIGASVYAACRKWKIPHTLEDIERRSRITRRELGRCYRLLLDKLEIIVPMTSPLDFIPRFSSALILSERTQQKAATILMLAREKGITVGKDPTGLAASALYIASVLEGERRTQREIATVAQVTEVTIRNRYKEMAQKLNIQLKI